MNKVAHIGGYPLVVEPMLRYQRSNGLDCAWLLASEDILRTPKSFSKEEETLLLDGKFEIIHIHRPGSFFTADTKMLEKHLENILSCKKRGSKILFHSYSFDHCAQKDILELADAYLVSDSSSLDTAKRCKIWSWVFLPLDLDAIPAAPLREPSKESAKLLHITGVNDQTDSYKTILGCIEELRDKGISINLKTIALAECKSIINEITQADAVIEQITAPSYGVIGALTLAVGKTLFSGCSPELQKEIDPLAFSPVLDTSLSNLAYRLESVWKEPRCMRDFGKRGRSFADRFHRLDSAGLLVNQIYAQLR